MERKMTIKEAYELECAIDKRYHGAKEAGDEGGMKAARAEIKELYEEIGTGAFERIYSAYKEAKKTGNEYVDLNWCIWDNEVAELISCMRENGMEHFTFSSTWSSSTRIAWLFTKNGCAVEGMVEIGGYKEVPAYMFRIG